MFLLGRLIRVTRIHKDVRVQKSFRHGINPPVSISCRASDLWRHPFPQSNRSSNSSGYREPYWPVIRAKARSTMSCAHERIVFLLPKAARQPLMSNSSSVLSLHKGQDNTGYVCDQARLPATERQIYSKTASIAVSRARRPRPQWQCLAFAIRHSLFPPYFIRLRNSIRSCSLLVSSSWRRCICSRSCFTSAGSASSTERKVTGASVRGRCEAAA